MLEEALELLAILEAAGTVGGFHARRNMLQEFQVRLELLCTLFLGLELCT